MSFPLLELLFTRDGGGLLTTGLVVISVGRIDVGETTLRFGWI